MSILHLLLGAGSKITIIGTEKTSPSSGTSLIINKPSDVQSGDLLIAFVAAANRSDESWSGPAGWTERAEANDGGNNPDIAVYTKTAGGSEGASYTFTYSTSANLSGCVIALRRCSYDTVGALARASSTSRPITGLTVTSPGSAILAFVATQAGSETITPPAGMEAISSEAGSTGPNWSAMVARPIPSGATGDKTATSTGSGDGGSYMLSVSPS